MNFEVIGKLVNRAHNLGCFKPHVANLTEIRSSPTSNSLYLTGQSLRFQEKLKFIIQKAIDDEVACLEQEIRVALLGGENDKGE